MQAWGWMLGGVAALALGGGACTPATPSLPDFHLDGGQRGATCPSGYNVCETKCCPDGTQCVAGECKYPYSGAHLFVYLCPSFDNGNCSASFFQLDQMCSPLRAEAHGGTCYDTGLEVSANAHYGLTTCQECGSKCGSPSSLSTPAGFFSSDYYSGFAFSCGQDCKAPPDCGGPSTDGSGGASGGSGGSHGSGTGTTTTTTTTTTRTLDGGVAISSDAGGDAAASSATGLCATSAAGKCVKCSGASDPSCGAETCCELDGKAFCTDIGVAACIMCKSDSDCDPGVPCCK